MKITIGVIGCGFVGKAIVRGFLEFADIRIYDVDNKKSTTNFEETIKSDFVFICLPTPMISAEGGKANLSIIEKCFEEINNLQNRNPETIFLIKSTVPIGTTRKLSEKYPELLIAHCPEFLTARASITDFICSSRIIIGSENPVITKKAKELFEYRFPGTLCLEMSSEESEMVKYAANCFFATKVIFFNEIKLLVEKLGLLWENILDGVISDGRIGKSHFEVPGYDGDRGFGGTCFPKDINSLIHVMEENEIDPLVLKAVWEQNKKIRRNWDWAKNSSSVRSEGDNE